MPWGSNNSKDRSSSSPSAQLIPGRVLSIDQTSTLSNGDIMVEPMKVTNNLPGSLGIKASPLFPNIKNYPLKNETVYLLSFPGGNFSSNPGDVKYYYLSPVKIWPNATNTNPTPNTAENIQGSNQNKSLQEIELGSPNVSTKQQTSNFKPGTYFTEKSNIFPLFPFEGDVIVEGRFGNSIRFGSTDIQYGSNTTQNIITKQFEESYTYPSGETDLPLSFNSKLVAVNNKVGAFFQKYDDDNISIFIESVESQVPNPNNIVAGELAKLRAQKAQDLVSSLSNFKYNISVNSRIGDTPYIPGRDKPDDPKYLKDQYTSIKILVQGTEVIDQPSQPQSLNNWSVSGSNGDPITILRNGQNPELTGSALSLTVEDINKDLSSAYFTSTQNIPIEVSSKNDYFSYSENLPTDPKDYNGAQIILNSGRLLFNTTQDHIMLSSKKSINLNSIEGINVDTVGPVVIEAPEIKLGSNDAEESVLLGDSTVDLLQNLISDLVSLTKIMGSQIGNNGILLEPTATTARTISNNLSTYQSQLDSLKSNIVKVE
jgi:hypothetical protein